MKTEPLKTWTGQVNACDICGCQPFNTFIDGRIKGSLTSAIMCADCYVDIGIGLGVGKGQIYKKEKIEQETFWIDRTPKK